MKKDLRKPQTLTTAQSQDPHKQEMRVPGQPITYEALSSEKKKGRGKVIERNPINKLTQEQIQADRRIRQFEILYSEAQTNEEKLTHRNLWNTTK